MGILGASKPSVIICTRDRARSTAFYRDTLGLAVAKEDAFADIFDAGGVALRVSAVPDFTPHGHTMLGFHVADVVATVTALRAAGVEFMVHSHMTHDEMGIWTSPGGAVSVAWFKDPDGNLLSVSNA